MRRFATFAVFAVAGLAAHVLLRLGAFDSLPAGLRLSGAFAVLVVLPGFALLAALRVTPPGGRWLSAGWALGLGVGWLGAQVMCTRLLHVPFTVLAVWAAAPNALLWLLPAWRSGRDEEPRTAAQDLGPVALALVMAAALVACVHVARVPAPVSFVSDSPDHVGTVRRMMAEGDAFPVDAFFRDAGRAGADPRKGLWHPGIATIATLAHADPLEAWWTLAALLAPLFALNVAAFAFLLGGPTAAAIGAWALVLTYGGSLASPGLREAVFSTKLADQLALATVTAVLVDLDTRRASSRTVAIGLALGAVATHVFGALQFGVVFGALGVGLLVVERGAGPRARRLLVTAGALALVCLPYLLWRARSSYAPDNIIHTAPQGLLMLAPGITVVSPAVLWDWFGPAWVVFPLSLLAWARQASRPAVLVLLTTTVAVAVLLFCPPVVAILQPRLGYLLMRFVWVLSLPAALAFAIPVLVRSACAGPARARIVAALALAGLGALVAPAMVGAARVLADPAGARAIESVESVLRWRGALLWMDAHLPAGSVVLSDPATSYSIPMMTRHHVVTLVDQHSSPGDSLGLTRIVDARDALDPGSDWSRTREVVERWGVTVIALNYRFGRVPRLDYWAPSPEWFRAARARLDRAPQAFERVYDSGDFVVYLVRAAGLRLLTGGGSPRTFVLPFDAVRDSAPVRRDAGIPDLVRARLLSRETRAGDSVAVVLDWHSPQPLPAGSYEAVLHFDGPRPPGFAPPGWCAWPARKVLERLRHERYAFDIHRPPVSGAYGVDLWRPAEVVRDSFWFSIPSDAAPGEYRMDVRMLRSPHYPNYRLADFVSDRENLNAAPVGALRIVRGVR